MKECFENERVFQERKRFKECKDITSTKEHYKNERARKNEMRIVVIKVTARRMGTFLSLSDGMLYTWTSPILPLLLSPSSPVPTKESDSALLENMYLVGGVIGLPITMYLSGKLSRKTTILTSALGNLTVWLLTGFGTNQTTLLIARVLAGLSANISYSTLPMYIAEVSDKNIRGCLGSVIHIMTLLGTILIYCVGPFLSLPASSTIGGGIVVFHVLTFSFMPESPYYLLTKGYVHRARRSLQILRCSNDVEEELTEIEETIKIEYKNKPHLIDLVRTQANRKVLLIMVVLMFSENFSGITVLFMNIHIIFKDIPGTVSENTMAILFAVIMCCGCVFATFLIDRAGRVSLLVSSGFFTGISLLVFSSYLLAKSRGDVSSYNWIPLVTMIIFASTYKYGVGLVPVVLASEMFSTNVKPAGMAITAFLFIISGIISISLYYALKGFGMFVPFYFFGCCCLLTSLFSLFCIPETKMRSLEEIQELIGANNSKTVYQEIR
ncbi:hypothetical protein FQA39_LY14456 [Lamprigera yunnana]|nr:hypothetical protein FQA39_LY14456 [Lamprigera yunnana]